MPDSESLRWLAIIAVVAYFAFRVGRAVTSRGGQTALERETSAEALFNSLPPSKQADVDRLIQDGAIIEAIKLIRAETGAGLREAKDVADMRKRRLGRAD